MKGTLGDLSVSDLIQLACQERKSSKLIVECKGRQAEIWFSKGEVIHASLDDQIGEEVVYQILSWENGKFSLEASGNAPETSIKRSWASLLLEGANRLDEEKLNQKNLSKDKKNKKESPMNVKKMEEIVKGLQEDLSGGLVATDIFSSKDGQSLAGFNTQPKASALFNEITRYLNKSLKGSNFPGLGSYYMVHLENNFVVVVVPQGDIQEGMLVDLSKTSLGILMNVAVPKIIEGLKDAVK